MEARPTRKQLQICKLANCKWGGDTKYFPSPVTFFLTYRARESLNAKGYSSQFSKKFKKLKYSLLSLF